MTIHWTNELSRASDTEVDTLELAHHVRLSREHRQFLTRITNGGSPVEDLAIPAVDCPYGAGGLLGVYGINNPADYYDMATAFEANKRFLPHLVPFGYDQGSSQVFVDMISTPGRLVYIPLDELQKSQPAIYHAANSIAEFLEKSAELTVMLNSEG